MLQSNMKKVLVLVPAFPVPTETFIERELAYLAKDPNIDLHVLSLAKAKGYLSPSLEGRVDYKRISWGMVPLHLLTFVLYFFKYFTVFWRALIELNSNSKKPNLFKQLYFLARVYGFYVPWFAKYKPDFVIGHFMSEPSSVCMVHKLLTGIPYGVMAHARDVFLDGEYFESKVKTANFISVCNRRAHEYLLSSAQKANLPTANIILRYHGIDPTLLPFKVVEHYNAPIQKIRIFNNARLTEKKGHVYLFDAVKELLAQGFDVELNLVSGAGNLTDWARNYILSNNLLGKINLLNEGKGVPFEQISTLYHSNDLFVYTGINTDAGDSDGIANVLIEAAFAGLPIISTDSGATTEFLTNGVDTAIVDQKSTRAIVSAIKDYILNPQKFAEYAQNAHKKAVQTFDIRTSVAELKNLF